MVPDRFKILNDSVVVEDRLTVEELANRINFAWPRVSNILLYKLTIWSDRHTVLELPTIDLILTHAGYEEVI